MIHETPGGSGLFLFSHFSAFKAYRNKFRIVDQQKLLKPIWNKKLIKMTAYRSKFIWPYIKKEARPIHNNGTNKWRKLSDMELKIEKRRHSPHWCTGRGFILPLWIGHVW